MRCFDSESIGLWTNLLSRPHCKLRQWAGMRSAWCGSASCRHALPTSKHVEVALCRSLETRTWRETWCLRMPSRVLKRRDESERALGASSTNVMSLVAWRGLVCHVTCVILCHVSSDICRQSCCRERSPESCSVISSSLMSCVVCHVGPRGLVWPKVIT